MSQLTHVAGLPDWLAPADPARGRTIAPMMPSPISQPRTKAGPLTRARWLVPDPQLVRADAGHLADYPHALRQLHQRDDHRQRLARHRRVMVHDVAVDLAGARRDDVPAVTGLPARRAFRPGRMAQRAELGHVQQGLGEFFPGISGAEHIRRQAGHRLLGFP